MTDLKSHRIQIQGLKANYYTAGEGPNSVVLLHGGGTDSALLSWRLAIPELAKTHTVIAPDWPGYGESQVFEGDYSFEKMTAWLVSLLDELRIEKAAFAGVSMGGGGALSLAIEQPQRIEKLALVDSYGLADTIRYYRLSYWMVHNPRIMDWSWAIVRRSRRLARMSLAQIFADPRHITPDLEEEVFQALQDPSGQKAFANFQAVEMLPDRLLTCYMDRLDTIDAPALIIQGKKDALVPLSAAKEAAERMPNARLEVIEEAGHWPMREKPELFNRLLLDFINSED